jgi:GT2 family glycosyltransferase
MQNKKLLSIISPCFNEEQNIARAIESVRGFAQEVLVIDSGSTDHQFACPIKPPNTSIFHRALKHWR